MGGLIIYTCLCGNKSEKLTCSSKCKNKLSYLQTINRRCGNKQKHINEILWYRWELLERLLPPEYKKLMYRVEQKYPLIIKNDTDNPTN